VGVEGRDREAAEIGHVCVWTLEYFDCGTKRFWGEYGSYDLAKQAEAEFKIEYPGAERTCLRSRFVLVDPVKYDAALLQFNREAAAIADLVSMAAGNW